MNLQIMTREELEKEKLEFVTEDANIYCNVSEYCTRKGQYGRICATDLSIFCPFHRTYTAQSRADDALPQWLRRKVAIK